MYFRINKQIKYSRSELLIRTFFGFFYISIPHNFLLLFLNIWGSILTFIAFWSILFTGRYPESFYEYHVKLHRWNLRVSARLSNLLDGYPKFGLDSIDEDVVFDVPYPENLSKSDVILKFFFGWLYIGIPHGIALFFRSIATSFIVFIAFWIVLFTGNFPERMFYFIEGTLRWQTRVAFYLGYMTDKYPPFTGFVLDSETRI